MTLELNYVAVLAAVVAVFVVSSVYYVVLAPRLATLSPAWADTSQQPVWKIVQEPFRTLVTAVAVAALTRLLGITEVGGAVLLALALWFAFPAALLAGSVIHENVPWKLATVHGGDWLLTLLIIGICVAL